jgi:hypothetical protein
LPPARRSRSRRDAPCVHRHGRASAHLPGSVRVSEDSPHGLQRCSGERPRFVLPVTIPEGTRNTIMTAYGGRLRHSGASEAQILQELAEANRKRCVPPLGLREVSGIAHSVARYVPAHYPLTWGVPPAGYGEDDDVHQVRHPPREADPAVVRGRRLVYGNRHGKGRGEITRLTSSQFSVRGRRGTTAYAVNLGPSGGSRCSCARSKSPLNCSGNCAHQEAVRLWLAIHYSLGGAGPLTP